MKNYSKYETDKIVVLGGAFSTGKSTMLERIKQNCGEQYRYITDGAREIIQDHTNGRYDVEQCDLVTLQKIQRDVMDYYLHEESKGDGRLTISDGSLVEVAAYSQHVLDHYDFFTLNSVLSYRNWKELYDYVKFPVNATPITYDGVRHTDYNMQSIVDKRIDKLLALNPNFKLLILPQAMTEFSDRYKRVLKFIKRSEFHG